MKIISHCLAIPEILENIFTYITDYKDFINLLNVNYIWQEERAYAFLKLYRNKLYRYNHNIHNILLMDELFCLQSDRTKPVYSKIYQPQPGEDTRYIDCKEEFEMMEYNIEYCIYNLKTISNMILPFDIMKKNNNLIIDYKSLVDRIDKIFNGIVV